MRLKRSLSFALVLWFGFAAVAAALSTDKELPLTITADAAELDDKAGRAVYRGNVRIAQGTLSITGEMMVLERRDGEVYSVIITGEPATYRQQPDGGGDDVVAEARMLKIYPQENMVRLERDAKVSRQGRVFAGAVIEYNNKEDIIRAYGDGKGDSQSDGPATGGSGSSDRVRIVLPPQ